MQDYTNSMDSYNFWIKCQKCSNGREFCYMYCEQGTCGIAASEIKRVSNQHFNKPKKCTGRANIFVNRYSDFFLSDVDDWREEAWKVIHSTPQYIWTILSKRSENIIKRLLKDWANLYSDELPSDMRLRDYPEIILNNQELPGLFNTKKGENYEKLKNI